MATVVEQAEARNFMVQNVPWELYDHAVREMSHGASRMIFDEGVLEVMTVSPKHELIKTGAARVLEYLAVENDWPLSGLGNVTLRRKDLRIGLEPDECYYIVTLMPDANAGELDLLTNPPPDMAIEVEVTKSSLSKISIYARIGVREVWRWTGERFIVLERTDAGEYTDRTSSALLPNLSFDLLSEFTLKAARDGQPAAMRELRQRLRKS